MEIIEVIKILLFVIVLVLTLLTWMLNVVVYDNKQTSFYILGIITMLILFLCFDEHNLFFHYCINQIKIN